MLEQLVSLASHCTGWRWTSNQTLARRCKATRRAVLLEERNVDQRVRLGRCTGLFNADASTKSVT